MNDEEVNILAKKVWDYNLLHQKLEKADCIIVLGSRDVRVAEWGAELFLGGFAPLLLLSGGLVGYAKREWGVAEAEKFAEVAMQKGVPQDKILIENQSANTGENVTLSRRLLAVHGIKCKKVVAVHRPYMERRTYATIKKQWPEVEVVISSPPISFKDLPNDVVTKEDFLRSMLADVLKIKEYPALGFQIEQEIPDDVWEAYEKLVAAGFGKPEL
jgi:uncharacterized SAM-binding protein YcdF (DUF218 family)